MAKVDITDRKTRPVNDPLFVRALVLRTRTFDAVIISVDVVAIGEIGPIGNDYLPSLRKALKQELGIRPEHVLVNASHCHGSVCADVKAKTVEAVRRAWQHTLPVRVGAGHGHEDRISINRRLRMKDGRIVDVRHAYSMPPDNEVAALGPIDPEIGIVRLDRTDGTPLAILYNFACHPILGVPSGANTADITGFASRVIEDNLGQGTVALFLQGCAGDINPVYYKDVDHIRHAETLGNQLGLSTLKAARAIRTREDSRLVWIRQILRLPRADWHKRIQAMEARQQELVASLHGTSLNLKTFMELTTKYRLAETFPSYYADQYLKEERLGVKNLKSLDAENRRNMEKYLHNVLVMEKLTRLRTNLALLKKHQADNAAAGDRFIEAELLGLRIGECVLITFPGELTAQIGLDIKSSSPYPLTFVAGYTNGYLYYTPEAEQLRNPGWAQEDCDCVVAPQWEKVFRNGVSELLKKLAP